MALWQDRYGPNRVGPFGLLQVLADMIKIFTKEDWIPPFADKAVFVLAPAIVVTTTLVVVRRGRLAPGIVVVDLNVGLLYFLGHVVFGRIWRGAGRLVVEQQVRAVGRAAGRRPDGKLRGLYGPVADGRGDVGRFLQPERHRRGSAGTCGFASPAIGTGGVSWWPDWRETRRIPFDLPEAENELIAGYHAEYSGMKFGMFFLGEYVGVTLISAMIVLLFFGGWLGPWLPPLVWFGLKLFVCVVGFILVRADAAPPAIRPTHVVGMESDVAA